MPQTAAVSQCKGSASREANRGRYGYVVCTLTMKLPGRPNAIKVVFYFLFFVI